MSWYESVEQFWNNETLLLMLGSVSLLSLLFSLFVIPLVVVRIPVDYFAEQERHLLPWARRHMVIRWLGLILKNFAGTVFITLGIAMLFLPGQGLLTMFIGILLLNFPGKYRLERWVIRQPSVLNSANWLRVKAGRPPLIVDGYE